MSLEPVPPGHLAAVVTYLEMRQRPPTEVPASALRLQRLEDPSPAVYRRLFRRIGSPWLWFSRLLLDDAALSAIIRHPDVELFAVVSGKDPEAGMLELDFRVPGECELAFLGLVPELSGQGHGRWLLAEATGRAWRETVDRVHVHTCTLDHPAALAAYRRAGFIPVRQAVETFADPRLAGILPMEAAPHVPLLGTPTSAAAS